MRLTIYLTCFVCGDKVVGLAAISFTARGFSNKVVLIEVSMNLERLLAFQTQILSFKFEDLEHATSNKSS